MNTDADGYVKIGAFIDPTGVQAGAGEVVQAVDKIGTAAKEGGGSFDNATLSNRRNLTHLVHGLLELKEGGIDALGGLATEAYLTGEAMDVAMGPIGIVLLGFSIAIPILTRAWGEHKGKVDENKTSTDALKTANDEYKSSIDALLGSLNAVEESDARRLANLSETQTLASKQIELDKNIAIERVKANYLADYAGAKTQDERDRLTSQFDAAKKGIEAGSAVAIAQEALNGKQKEVDAQKQTLLDTQKAQADLQENLDQKKREADVANAVLGSQIIPIPQTQEEIAAGAPQQFQQGIQLNDKGELPEGSTAPAQKIVDDLKTQIGDKTTELLQDQTPEGAARSRGFGLDPDQVQGGLKAQINDLTEKLKAAQATVDAITAAPEQLSVYNAALKDTAPKIAEQGKKAQEAADKYNNLIGEAGQAQQEVGLQMQRLATEKQQAAIDADKKAADLHAKAFQEAIRDATKNHQQSQRGIEDRLHQAEGQIRATGSKGADEALKKLLETVFDKQQELSGSQAILAEAVAGKFKQVDARMNQHKTRTERAIQSLSNVGGYQ